MKELNFKIVHMEEYKGRNIVITKQTWCKEVIEIVNFGKVPAMLHDYHNGYVELKLKWYKQLCNNLINFLPFFPYQFSIEHEEVGDKFISDELTFSGYLNYLPNIPEKLKKIWFFGFDSIHYWNSKNPASSTKKEVLKRARGLCDEMINEGY